jgi:hypothetical protein
MPKFPTYDRQQGLSGGSTASFQSAGAFAAPGQALADLGGSIADAGQRFDIAQQKVQNSQDDTWFSKARAETALEMQNAQNELRQQATDGAQGYTDTVKSRYEQVRQNYLKGAPSDRARQMFEEWSNSYSANVIGDAATFQAESTLTKRNDDFAKAMMAHSQVVLADPNQYDSVRKRAMDDLAGARQWMTPDQEVKARNTVEQELQLARAKAEIQRDPAKFLQEIGVTRQTVKPAKVEGTTQSRGQQAMAFYMQKGYTKEQAAGIVGNLIGESNLNTGAVGDSGTAEGIAQWRGERLNRLKRFAASRGKDYKDFETQLDFVDLELQNNEKAAYQALKSAKTVDEATAAFIGYERPKGWTAANPRGGHNYKGRLGYAAAMAGGDVVMDGTFSPSVAGDQRYSSLDVNQVIGLQEQAQSQVAAIARQEQASLTAQLAQIKGSLQLGIATGDTSITPHTILSSPLLDDDKAQLIKSYNEANEEGIAVGQALPLLRDGKLGEVVDPYDSKGKKLVDNIYDKAAVSEDQRQALAETIVQQTGIPPQSMLNSIRKGLTDTNVANVEAAAQQAARIAAIDPAALGRREGGSEVQKRADDFSYFVNSLNMSPTEAAERIAEMNDPEKQRDRKALEPAAKEFRKQLEDEDLAELFDESWLPATDPDLGFTEGQALGMQAEYQAIAEDQFFRANGNADLAKNRAKEEMKRLYGVTNITGRPVVMKYPPERYWPKNTASQGGLFGIGADPLGYAKTQLHAEIAGRDADFDPESVQFVTTPATEQMIKRGEMPGYAVFYTDKDGVLQTFPGMLWRPDLKPAQAAMEGQQKQRAEEAAAEDEFQRERVIPGQDREQTLDNFLYGNPLTGQVD